MTEPSNLSRFGLTCAVLTADRGEALLTSYLADFRARTSAPPAKAQELTESAADFGRKWPGLFAILDRNTSSWKTPQYSLLGGLDAFSETWTRSGTMRNGQCYLLPMLEHRILEKGYGYWPTPVASEATAGARTPDGKRGARLTDIVKRPELWPTPTASMITTADIEQAKYHSSKRPSYQDAKMPYPTPNTIDAKGGTRRAQGKKNQTQLCHIVGGQLNPTWVEWLMGWPLGWTDLELLATGKSPLPRQQHSAY